MVNVSTNLLLIKVRQQYGLRHFAELGLAVYALLSIAHVFVEGLGMAMFVRAASGFAAAAINGDIPQAVRERIPELAVLKTIGFKDGSVLGLVLAESVLLVLIGGVLGLGLAVNETWNDRQGQRQEKTHWIDATLWRDLAIVAAVVVVCLGLGAATLRRRTA